MIRRENIQSGVFFVCDECGQEYTFSGSYLTVMAGRKFRRYKGAEMEVAKKDLCRDCAGQQEKLGNVAQLDREVAAIDAAAERYVRR